MLKNIFLTGFHICHLLGMAHGFEPSVKEQYEATIADQQQLGIVSPLSGKLWPQNGWNLPDLFGFSLTSVGSFGLTVSLLSRYCNLLMFYGNEIDWNCILTGAGAYLVVVGADLAHGRFFDGTFKTATKIEADISLSEYVHIANKENTYVNMFLDLEMLRVSEEGELLSSNFWAHHYLFSGDYSHSRFFLSDGQYICILPETLTTYNAKYKQHKLESPNFLHQATRNNIGPNEYVIRLCSRTVGFGNPSDQDMRSIREELMKLDRS